MKNKVISRKELYDQLWSFPKYSVIKKYNITNHNLMKICLERNIPLPPNGYWQKIKHGKNFEIPNLPNEKIDSDIDISIMSSGKTPEQIRLNEIMEEIELNHKKYLKVPLKLKDPMGSIITAMNSLKSKRPNLLWKNGKLVSTNLKDIPVTVAPKNILRALNFLDTFLKLAKSRNHILEMKSFPPVIIIDGENYQFGIREMQRRIKDATSPNEINYEPTGLLVFRFGRFYEEKRFADGRQPLESKLSIILAQMEFQAEKWKQIRLKNENDKKIREDQKRILDEERKREETEKQKFQDLIGLANRWHQSKLIREFVKEVEFKNNGNSNHSESFNNWLDWAKKKIDLYDPIVDENFELPSEGNKLN